MVPRDWVFNHDDANDVGLKVSSSGFAGTANIHYQKAGDTLSPTTTRPPRGSPGLTVNETIAASGGIIPMFDDTVGAAQSAPGLKLAERSQAERRIAEASNHHCTITAVLGDGVGIRRECESHLEYGHLLRANADPDVLHLQEQVLFRFRHGTGSEARRFFDFVADMKSGSRIAFTVKPEKRLRSGKFLADMQMVARHVRETGFASEVRLLTERDLDPIDWHNGKVFAAIRDIAPDAVRAVKTLIGHFMGALTLRELTEQTGRSQSGYHALLFLLRKGELRLARRERITPQTLVLRKEMLQ